jgi:hypothetical protein
MEVEGMVRMMVMEDYAYCIYCNTLIERNLMARAFATGLKTFQGNVYRLGVCQRCSEKEQSGETATESRVE